MGKDGIEGIGEDDFIVDARFELDEGDDRLGLVVCALDYRDPGVIGNLDLISDGVIDRVDHVDLEEGGFGVSDLMFGRSHKDTGARVNYGFQIVDSGRLNRWKTAGRIPRTVKTADQFDKWCQRQVDKKSLPPDLDVISIRRLTGEVLKLFKGIK